MKSLVVFNINTGLISNCVMVENEQIKKNWEKFLIQDCYNHNGEIIICIGGDWRDFTNKQLATKCDEIIMSICKSRLGDDYN